MAFNKSGASYLKNVPKLVSPSFFPFFSSTPAPPSLPRLHFDALLGARGALHNTTLAKTRFLSLPTRNERKLFSPARVQNTTREESVAILGGYGQYLCFQVAVPVACACVLAWWKCMAAAFQREEEPGGRVSAERHICRVSGMDFRSKFSPFRCRPCVCVCRNSSWSGVF